VNERSGSSGCPDAAWRVWDAYSSRVPGGSLAIVRALFERICEVIQERRLDWTAHRDGQTIGFKASRDGMFKIAVHAGTGPNPQERVLNPPSFLIHPGLPLSELGIDNPYPDLKMFWDERFRAQGWNVFSEWRIPDVGIAVDLAVEHGRP
jgi:hypothetical protein